MKFSEINNFLLDVTEQMWYSIGMNVDKHLFRKLHQIADEMVAKLCGVLTDAALDGLDDVDDIRQAYGEWFSDDIELINKYDRLNSVLLRDSVK